MTPFRSSFLGRRRGRCIYRTDGSLLHESHFELIEVRMKVGNWFQCKFAVDRNKDLIFGTILEEWK